MRDLGFQNNPICDIAKKYSLDYVNFDVANVPGFEHIVQSMMVMSFVKLKLYNGDFRYYSKFGKFKIPKVKAKTKIKQAHQQLAECIRQYEEQYPVLAKQTRLYRLME